MSRTRVAARPSGQASEAKLLTSGPVTVHPGDLDSGRLKDRYSRTLATIKVDGRDVGKIMIAEGLARPWTGKRRPWCN